MRPIMDDALPEESVLCGMVPESVLCSALFSAIISTATDKVEDVSAKSADDMKAENRIKFKMTLIKTEERDIKKTGEN